MLKAEKTTSRFLKVPSLGGIIAIVYCLLWIVAVVVAPNLKSNPTAAASLDKFLNLLLFPLIVFVVPSQTTAACVLFGVIVSLHSLIWGYSIAWLVKGVMRAGHYPDAPR